MTDELKNFLDQAQKSGALAIFANLLFDAAMLGWIVFAGLYAVEALLPTFVTARLSLVKFGIILIGLTALLAYLRKNLPSPESEKSSANWLPWVTVLFLAGIIAIAHYRFPWWSIPICLGGYLLIAWLFLKNQRGTH